MYAQKAIVHNAPTLHTVRNVHNAHCAYRFKVQSCDCINFVRAIEHGSITTAQAAEILKVKDRRARTILMDMVEKAYLRKEGAARSTIYVQNTERK